MSSRCLKMLSDAVFKVFDISSQSKLNLQRNWRNNIIRIPAN